MFKEEKYYRKMWKNNKKRKEFEREFKSWTQEDKHHFLYSGFQIQFEDWVEIKKIKVYLSKDTKDDIRMAVYTDEYIWKFYLFMTDENVFHPLNYDDGLFHMDYEIMLKRTPLI